MPASWSAEACPMFASFSFSVGAATMLATGIGEAAVLIVVVFLGAGAFLELLLAEAVGVAPWPPVTLPLRRLLFLVDIC